MEDRKENIKVSVICLAYNHENYIRKMLDGIVHQQADFLYELLIHDDASTDKTAEIIREYQQKYPSIVKPIYQEVNQYSQRIPIIKTFLLPLAKGQYVAFCEGDDYWCDNHKLQAQVDYMETHCEHPFCTHYVSCVNRDGSPLDRAFPSYKLTMNEITLHDLMNEEFRKEKWFLHINSYLIRTEIYRNYMNDKPDFAKSFYRIGDLPLTLYLLSLGNGGFLHRSMSCYRMLSGGVMSKLTENKDFAVKVAEGKAEGLQKFNEYTGFAYQRELDHAICAEEVRICFLKRDYKSLRKRKYFSYIFGTKNLKRILLFLVAVCFPNLLSHHNAKSS